MKKGMLITSALLLFAGILFHANAEMKVTPKVVLFPNQSAQNTACDPPWGRILDPAVRFQVVINNQAVLDRETGLVWQRNTDTTTTRNWLDACTYCYRLSLDPCKGWRLPTIEELATLVDPGQTDPALPPGNPFTHVQLRFYWSISTNAADTNNAWIVNFKNGNVLDTELKTAGHYVLCVRGGHGYDAR